LAFLLSGVENRDDPHKEPNKIKCYKVKRIFLPSSALIQAGTGFFKKA